MSSMNKKKRIRRFIIIGLLAIVFGVLTYYQLLYKSPRVDNGIAKLQLTFNKHKHFVTSIRFSTDDSVW